jgi:hypothetical protein
MNFRRPIAAALCLLALSRPVHPGEFFPADGTRTSLSGGSLGKARLPAAPARMLSVRRTSAFSRCADRQDAVPGMAGAQGSASPLPRVRSRLMARLSPFNRILFLSHLSLTSPPTFA